MNLWKQEPAAKGAAAVPLPAVPGWDSRGLDQPGLAGAAPTANSNFNQPLNQTLGYLNKPFGTAGERRRAATRNTRSPG